jgi:hypothetical protein
MPHYYFHFTDGKRVCSDTNGLNLLDDEAARKEAKLVACDLWNDPADRRDWGQWTIEVADEDGRHVISFPIDRRWKISRLVSGLARWLAGSSPIHQT